MNRQTDEWHPLDDLDRDLQAMDDAIRGAIGHHALKRAEPRDDFSGTDVAIAPGRYGVRIRKETYFYRYPNDITFRHLTSKGYASETAKLLTGEFSAEWMLYGFRYKNRPAFMKYTIVDIAVLVSRYSHLLRREMDRPIRNTDPTQFVALKAGDIHRAIALIWDSTIAAKAPMQPKPTHDRQPSLF
jgi:hypothetical protein